MMKIINGTSTDIESINDKWVEEAEEMKQNPLAKSLFTDYVKAVKKRFADIVREDVE